MEKRKVLSLFKVQKYLLEMSLWQTGNLARWNLRKNLKKLQVPGSFLSVFKSQRQNGKMEISFFVLSLEISFGGVFVGDWKDGKMES